MTNISHEIKKTKNNLRKSNLIEESHALRKSFLFAIRDADTVKAKEFLNKTANYLSHEDPMDIMKRIEGNELRSRKNVMLSHNSMYALMAELGGLNPVLSHYMSEKYAILIESSQSDQVIDRLHNQMVVDYSSPSNRYMFSDNMTLSTKVNYYIENNFMNELNMQMIAEEFFVTKEHLMRTFKKETGKTINEVIKRSRLDEAEELLLHSSLSVTDIAIMTGFNSVQYFSTVFKEYYGMTPTEYQNR